MSKLNLRKVIKLIILWIKSVILNHKLIIKLVILISINIKKYCNFNK